MGEKPIKETKENKFFETLLNHPVMVGITILTALYALWQMSNDIYNYFRSNVAIDWKALIPIVPCILVIIILLSKNKKLNNEIKSQKNDLESLKTDLESHKTALESHKSTLEAQKNILESLPYAPDDLAEMKNMGITRCTSKLEDTDFDPNNCMNTIKRKLFFLGVGGAKWIQKPPSKLQLFRKMLLRVMANNGEVFFLIINPCGASFKLLEKQREGDVNNAKTYKIWLDLIKEFNCLKVKCYEHAPTFRLQFMDDHLMAVSRYQFEKEQYDNYNQGWDSPHLIIDNTNDMSFYTVFEQYFNREWKEAKDIDKIDKIKELIEHG